MKQLILFALLLFSTAAIADSRLPEIRETLKWVETEHNPTLVGDNGASYGILQIQNNAIKDVNRHYGTLYKHEDAFDIQCAEEIFDLYIQMWAEKLKQREGRVATTKDIVRIWNGGPRGYKKLSTIKYYRKYLLYKNKTYLCNIMKENKQKCTIDGKLGLVTARYTHTMDVYLFKEKRHMVGVHRRYVKLLPLEKPAVNPAQLVINYES